MLISETREPSMVYFHLLRLCKCKKFDGATELLDLLDYMLSTILDISFFPTRSSPTRRKLVAIIVHDSISGRHS